MSNPNRKFRTLTYELQELERTDPAVGKAAREFDHMRDEFIAGGSYRERARRAITERRKHAGR